MASAKLANRQVNHSQKQIWTLNRLNWPGRNRMIGRPDGAEPHHEHDQVLDLVARMQLLERINHRLAEQFRIIEFDFCAHNCFLKIGS